MNQEIPTRHVTCVCLNLKDPNFRVSNSLDIAVLASILDFCYCITRMVLCGQVDLDPCMGHTVGSLLLATLHGVFFNLIALLTFLLCTDRNGK